MYMRKQKKQLYGLLITLVLMACFRIGYAQDTPVINDEIIIAHPTTPRDTLTLNQARTIFSLRARQWPNGTPITVVVLRDQNSTHKAFLRNTLNILPHQLRRHWDRYVYSGIGQGPLVVDNQEEMVKTVNKIPGAIGYIKRGEPHEQVITLTVR